MSNRNVILWLFGIQTLEKLPSRLAELFLTLEYASHAIWEGQVKSKDFTLVEKLYENQLLNIESQLKPVSLIVKIFNILFYSIDHSQIS